MELRNVENVIAYPEVDSLEKYNQIKEAIFEACKNNLLSARIGSIINCECGEISLGSESICVCLTPDTYADDIDVLSEICNRLEIDLGDIDNEVDIFSFGYCSNEN